MLWITFTETYNHYDAICLPQKSLWEKLKEIGLDFVGWGSSDIGTTSAAALSTYLNSLDSSMGPAAIKDSSSIFEPIKQLHRQKIYSTYYKQVYSFEVKAIVEVRDKCYVEGWEIYTQHKVTFEIKYAGFLKCWVMYIGFFFN